MHKLRAGEATLWPGFSSSRVSNEQQVFPTKQGEVRGCGLALHHSSSWGYWNTIPITTDKPTSPFLRQSITTTSFSLSLSFSPSLSLSLSLSVCVIPARVAHVSVELQWQSLKDGLFIILSRCPSLATIYRA